MNSIAATGLIAIILMGIGSAAYVAASHGSSTSTTTIGASTVTTKIPTTIYVASGVGPQVTVTSTKTLNLASTTSTYYTTNTINGGTFSDTTYITSYVYTTSTGIIAVVTETVTSSTGTTVTTLTTSTSYATVVTSSTYVTTQSIVIINGTTTVTCPQYPYC